MERVLDCRLTNLFDPEDHVSHITGNSSYRFRVEFTANCLEKSSALALQVVKTELSEVLAYAFGE